MRSQIVYRFMGTLVYVEVPDILIDVLDGFPAAPVAGLQPFRLHLAPKALHWGVVPAVSLPAHTTHKTILLQQLLILFATVRGSSVRMYQAALTTIASCKGIFQGLYGQIPVITRTERQPCRHTSIQVQNTGYI